MALALGYNTNGFAFHRLEDAVEIIAELGYTGVALTLDVHHADPSRMDAAAWDALRGRIDANGLRVVIETGARYLLDSRHKHQPTLLSANDAARARRTVFLRSACDAAVALGATVVSLWSGTPRPEDGDTDACLDRLVRELVPLAEYAADLGLTLGFEPEPGMLIETLAQYEALAARVDHQAFTLTLDVGHCQCVETEPIPALIRRHASDLVNVQLDDMRRGVHEHLGFGEGEIDFPPVLAALAESGFAGLAAVELSAHSRVAVRTARESLKFLRAAADATDVDLV